MSAPFPRLQAFLLSVLSIYVVFYLPVAQPVHVLWHTYEPKLAAGLKIKWPRVYAIVALIAHTAVPLVPVAKYLFMAFAGRPWPSSSGTPVASSN